MTYIEALHKLTEIENTYDVESVRVDGVSVWPFLRIYLFQVIGQTGHCKAHRLSKGKFSTVVRGLFAYNPFKVFGKHRTWVFNAVERRKQLDGTFVHRVSGFVSELLPDALFIEKPSEHGPHHRKREIEEKFIVSESWILGAAHLLEKIMPRSWVKIENESLLKNILRENNWNFDYTYFVRYLLAQRKVLNFILKMLRKPDRVLIECPYNVMGYVWAFKEHGIDVVELQHGVVNESHYAYVYKHSSILFPDSVWVYGDREYDFFKHINPHYSRRVERTGLYILEKAKEVFATDLFAAYRSRYSKIIVFAGQTAVENQIYPFLKAVAEMNPDWLFVYIPRYPVEAFPVRNTNVMYAPNVNIYQYLKWCDVHATISSTTCLEAMYYGKPTVFYDFDNLASEYYGGFLSSDDGVEYITEASQFRNAVDRIDRKGSIEFPRIFQPFDKNAILNLLNPAI